MKKDTILILGALSDIGKSIAHQFALSGYDLQLAARNKEKLKSLSDDLKIRYEVNIEIYEFDVLEIHTHADFIKNLSHLPNILICTVGYLGEQKENETNIQLRLSVIRTNYEGPTNIISEFANLFEERNSGTIVGISSVAGERGRKNNYIYGSAKAGFTTFLSGLRNRLSAKNVHVLTVLPGTVYTKMTLGLKLPNLITTYPNKVAKDVFFGVLKKKNIIYSMGIWRLIMIIIKFIPESLFKKTNL